MGFQFDQRQFRFRDNDGSETGATWLAVANTDLVDFEPDTVTRVRFGIINDGDISRVSDSDLKLQYRLNSGTWKDVTDSSDVVQSSASKLTDGDDTTEQLSWVTGTFLTDNDSQCDDGDVTVPGTWLTNGYTELEASFTVVYEDVSEDDEIEFRVVEGDDTVFDGYTNTPKVTVAITYLKVADANHAHTAENIDLTQQHTLVIQNADDAHTVENLELEAYATLAISDSEHAHICGEPIFTQDHVLDINDGTSAVTSSNIGFYDCLSIHHSWHRHGVTPQWLGLDEHPLLVIEISEHRHWASELSLSPALIVEDGLHAHTADTVTFTLDNPLDIQDASHAHTAAAPALGNGLLITKAYHKHYASNVNIPYGSDARETFGLGDELFALRPTMKLPPYPLHDREMLKFAQELYYQLQTHYIPQTDRIENLLMIGDMSLRPDPVGLRQYFIDTADYALYVDVKTDTDTAQWVRVGGLTNPGESIELDTTAFDNNLSAADDTVQKAMETLDEVAGSGTTNSVKLTVYNDTGAQIDKGEVCYISGDQAGTPEVTKAQADAIANGSKMLVMLNENISDASSGQSMVKGSVTGFSGRTVGNIQYLDWVTAGDITETAPPQSSGRIVRVVGNAFSTTSVYFDPDKTWVRYT